MITESQCICGQKFLIEYPGHSFRTDKKRIYYPDEPNIPGMCVFRCRSCGEPVSETVPGAEYGEMVRKGANQK